MPTASKMGPCRCPGGFVFPLFVFLFENYESETAPLPLGLLHSHGGWPEETGWGAGSPSSITPFPLTS